jgi:hypothetical protein
MTIPPTALFFAPRPVERERLVSRSAERTSQQPPGAGCATVRAVSGVVASLLTMARQGTSQHGSFQMSGQ